MNTKIEISVGILTVSDRCSQGKVVDQSGPAIADISTKQNWIVDSTAVVPDESEDIKKIILNWADQKKLSLILTTGGTGLGPRDITPEVAQSLFHKDVPGISNYLRTQGSKFNSFSALSRGVSGVRNQSLIVTLPGSPSGVKESLNFLIPMIPHALKMIQGHNHEPKEKMRT